VQSLLRSESVRKGRGVFQHVHVDPFILIPLAPWAPAAGCGEQVGGPSLSMGRRTTTGTSTRSCPRTLARHGGRSDTSESGATPPFQVGFGNFFVAELRPSKAQGAGPARGTTAEAALRHQAKFADGVPDRIDNSFVYLHGLHVGGVAVAGRVVCGGAIPRGPGAVIRPAADPIVPSTMISKPGAPIFYGLGTSRRRPLGGRGRGFCRRRLTPEGLWRRLTTPVEDQRRALRGEGGPAFYIRTTDDLVIKPQEMQRESKASPA